MEKQSALIDASAFILIEASGDSDQAGYSDGEYSDAAEDDDDAQSCSCGSLSDAHEVDAVARDLHGADSGDRDEEEKEEEEPSVDSEEEEDGVVDQCGGGRMILSPENLRKSNKACEESSSLKMINDEDRDKRFWEACLAL